jgi:hypothetical protein
VPEHGWVVHTERETLEVPERVAGLGDPLERDWTAADGGFGSLENGDGGVIVRLAKVKADEVGCG